MIRNLLISVSILILLHGCASTSGSKSANSGAKETTSNTSKHHARADNEVEANKKAESWETDSYEQAKVITTASYDAAPEPIQRNKTAPASRDAVLDLLAQSKQAIDQNNYDEAENILQRVLRIEPGNAWVWYNMAVVSFYQANYHQAIQQALKSNNLENKVKALRNNNYKIIEQSYIELGEPVKAKSARKKIE
jgi:tetratricopeptide (TPR) repeat protein